MSAYYLRDYQQKAVTAIYDYFDQHDGHPVLVLPQGSGKSLVIAEFVRSALSQYPSTRILMLVHVKELIQQNLEKLLSLWPEAPVGVYSAGLNRRDTEHSILFAGIQSVYSRAADIAPRDLVIVDECHLLPQADDSMYQTLLGELRTYRQAMKVIGLTATPFRYYAGSRERTGGYDCLTQGGIFTDIAYSLNDRIPWLIQQGYLSMLWPLKTKETIDLSQVRVLGGEYVEQDLEFLLTDEAIMNRILDEAERCAGDRQAWLVFCAGVCHARFTTDLLNRRGLSAACVTGDTPADLRALFIDSFRTGELQALVSVAVLGTGFDAPETDLILDIAPTLSPIRYAQRYGRGMRPTARKKQLTGGCEYGCLVLDFAGNVRCHGPIDAIHIRRPGSRRDDWAAGAAVKTCPECQVQCALGTSTCPACGYEFPRAERKPLAEKLSSHAANESIIQGQGPAEPQIVPVSRVRYVKHTKDPSKPSTLRVEYYGGYNRIGMEWICLEHRGWAREKAARWWRRRTSALTVPDTVDAALSLTHSLQTPAAVRVVTSGRYPEITGYVFAPSPSDDPAPALAIADGPTQGGSEQNYAGAENDLE